MKRSLFGEFVTLLPLFLMPFDFGPAFLAKDVMATSYEGQRASRHPVIFNSRPDPTRPDPKNSGMDPFLFFFTLLVMGSGPTWIIESRCGQVQT